jgi:hypothetical protein
MSIRILCSAADHGDLEPPFPVSGLSLTVSDGHDVHHFVEIQDCNKISGGFPRLKLLDLICVS